MALLIACNEWRQRPQLPRQGWSDGSCWVELSSVVLSSRHMEEPSTHYLNENGSSGVAFVWDHWGGPQGRNQPGTSQSGGAGGVSGCFSTLEDASRLKPVRFGGPLCSCWTCAAPGSSINFLIPKVNRGIVLLRWKCHRALAGVWLGECNCSGDSTLWNVEKVRCQLGLNDPETAAVSLTGPLNLIFWL